MNCRRAARWSPLDQQAKRGLVRDSYPHVLKVAEMLYPVLVNRAILYRPYLPPDRCPVTGDQDIRWSKPTWQFVSR